MRLNKLFSKHSGPNLTFTCSRSPVPSADRTVTVRCACGTSAEPRHRGALEGFVRVKSGDGKTCRESDGRIGLRRPVDVSRRISIGNGIRSWSELLTHKSEGVLLPSFAAPAQESLCCLAPGTPSRLLGGRSFSRCLRSSHRCRGYVCTQPAAHCEPRA